MSRLATLSLALAPALVLGACGHSAPTRFFTLDPTPAPAPTAYAGPPVRVRSVHLPPLLDRNELAREVAPGEVKVSDFEQWAAPLGETARLALTQDLTARLPGGAVTGPDAPAPQGVRDLQVQVLSYNIGGGQAVMLASWSIAGESGGAVMQLSTPAAGTDGTAIAQSFSALLGQLSDRIAAGLAR